MYLRVLDDLLFSNRKVVENISAMTKPKHSTFLSYERRDLPPVQFVKQSVGT
jgi:hypothetical protein